MQKFKVLKLAVYEHYIRRRDNVLVQLDKMDGLNVEYHTVRKSTSHKVSTDGFRRGFRMLSDEERKKHANDIATTVLAVPSEQ